MTLNEAEESGKRAVSSINKLMRTVALSHEEDSWGERSSTATLPANKGRRRLVLAYINEFHSLCAAHKVQFPGQGAYTYGLCKMLDADNPDIATLLPYLLTSYIFNSQPLRTHRNDFLWNFVPRLEKYKDSPLEQEKLYGAKDLDADDALDYYDAFSHGGIGMLFEKGPPTNPDYRKVLERQANRFFLEADAVRLLSSGYPESSRISRCYIIPKDEGTGKQGLRIKFERLKNSSPLGEGPDVGAFRQEHHLLRLPTDRYIYDINLIQDIFVAWYQAIYTVLKERNETNQSRYPDALKCGILLLALFHSLDQPNWSETHWYFMQGIYDAVKTPAGDDLDMSQTEERARATIHQEIMDYDFWSDPAPEETDLPSGEGGADVDVVLRQPKPKRGRPKKLGGRIGIQVVSAEPGKEKVLDEQVFDTLEEANKYICGKWDI